MQDLLNQAWALIAPILIPALGMAIMSLITWACNEVRSSAWYAGLNWWQRKIVDLMGVQIMKFIAPKTVMKKDIQIAVTPQVEALMDYADQARNSAGKIPYDKAKDLESTAVEDALTALTISNPEIFKKLKGDKLVAQIVAQVDPVVQKVRRKRRVDFSTPGTKGGR